MYCTKADLLKRYSEYELLRLTDDDNIGVINDVVLNQAIDDATAEIESYLISRYTLPLSNPNDDLINKACQLTWFYLHFNRGEVNRDSQIQRRYDAIIRFFEQVAKGAISLQVAEPDSKKQSSGALIDSNSITEWGF